jgi:hypothetical protein
VRVGDSVHFRYYLENLRRVLHAPRAVLTMQSLRFAITQVYRRVKRLYIPNGTATASLYAAHAYRGKIYYCSVYPN